MCLGAGSCSAGLSAAEFPAIVRATGWTTTYANNSEGKAGRHADEHSAPAGATAGAETSDNPNIDAKRREMTGKALTVLSIVFLLEKISQFLHKATCTTDYIVHMCPNLLLLQDDTVNAFWTKGDCDSCGDLECKCLLIS